MINEKYYISYRQKSSVGYVALKLRNSFSAGTIGVGDGRGHVPPPPKKKNGKMFFGQLLRKIREFFGQNHVKFGNVVNFSGKYHKN